MLRITRLLDEKRDLIRKENRLGNGNWNWVGLKNEKKKSLDGKKDVLWFGNWVMFAVG